MVNESCEAPFLFTLFHIVKLLLILTNLLLFSEYSDKFILSEYFLFIDILAQKRVFRVDIPLFWSFFSFFSCVKGLFQSRIVIFLCKNKCLHTTWERLFLCSESVFKEQENPSKTHRSYSFDAPLVLIQCTTPTHTTQGIYDSDIGVLRQLNWGFTSIKHHV